MADDNAYARAISSASLTKLGVGEVVEADGGAAALLHLMSAPFDLVLMDWYMPDVSGAGVMTVLRDPRFGAAAATPVILMTAYASRDNVLRARQLGVNEVLVKPFPPTSWERRLAACWARPAGRRAMTRCICSTRSPDL
ncbi:response regulator [Devosia ginsengisoli]|uniref:response regulator n=1 Tax=Devosia ginsengisoli TaxID=400770 RepID=UPI0026EAEE4C|nr:response regulator [Devosia ginsengisoli]MCR6669902.1 response regulator [Devosia ginsengisoli]